MSKFYSIFRIILIISTPKKNNNGQAKKVSLTNKLRNSKWKTFLREIDHRSKQTNQNADQKSIFKYSIRLPHKFSSNFIVKL